MGRALALELGLGATWVVATEVVMTCSRTIFCLILGTSACSSGGGGAPEQVAPVSWMPGRYALEASVGREMTGQEFRADLTVAPDGTMTLDSSSGLCLRPTPSQVLADQARGQATFDCGDAVFRLRAIPGSVRGEIVASVLEESRTQTACPVGQAGPCYIMRTERVTRRADLRVNPVR